MFTNFLKVTLRTLYRERVYAIINIAGLSLAIACCVIIGLWLHGELTYDLHNKQYKKIYRVVEEMIINGKVDRFARTGRVLGKMLADEYAEVEESVWFWVINDNKQLVVSENKFFYWDNVTYASNNVFKYFDHDIIYGDPKDIDGECAAVSETFAKKYYGDENPVGKMLDIRGRKIKISIVFADLPENSHLRYNILILNNPEIRIPDDEKSRRPELVGVYFYTYLIMPEDYDIRRFDNISKSFFNRHMAEDFKTFNATWKAWLQPLADIHYDTDAQLRRDEPTDNIIYVYGFEAVALFILIIACINYINLATARAAGRAKEVGMRKILGSGRKSLVIQFLGESVIFSLIAVFLGLALVEVLLNFTPLNTLLGKHLTPNIGSNPALTGWLIIFGVVLGIVAGLYPAFNLSSIAPLTSLVGKHRTDKGSIRLREILVFVQFAISVSVIACTLFMSLQMRFVSNMPLGFHKENRLMITLRTADVIEKVPTLKKELLKNSSILGVSSCDYMFGKSSGLASIKIDRDNNASEWITLNAIAVGEDFIKVMGMDLFAGHDISGTLSSDAEAPLIINEALVKKIGWDEPVGKKMDFLRRPGKVIGVLRDFHYKSLHNKIEPFVLIPMSMFGVPEEPDRRRTMIDYLVVNISGENIPGTLDFIKKKFAEFDPTHPFEFEFLDDVLNSQYFPEQRLMKLICIFTIVCIFISCLGLFGLAAFSTEQRKKEIGIRKVLGASTLEIIIMLAGSILMLVAGGAVVASFIAYFAMDEWLSGFAYRININKDLWVFLISAAIAAAVALITVAVQSYKTARANPVKALRYE